MGNESSMTLGTYNIILPDGFVKSPKPGDTSFDLDKPVKVAIKRRFSYQEDDRVSRVYEKWNT